MLTVLILVLAATNIAILGWLAISSITESYRKRHRIITYTRTSRGLVQILEHGLADGGLPPEVRGKIYEALNEQWELIQKELPKPRRKRDKSAANTD